MGILIGVALAFGANFFMQSDAKTFAVTPAPPINSAKTDVSIVIAANYLNTQFKQLIPKNTVIKQPSVALAAPNILKLTGVFDLTLGGQRVSANATISMQVAVQKGRVVLTVDKIEAGGVNVPSSFIGSALDSIRAPMEDQINSVIANSLKGTALKLTNVRATANDLTIDLTGQ
ncbi:MAG: hypothetical protein HY327_07655 [Chloroflexi bacterium]|nr:hypothetical protein [Chloroflexota bacterium]